MRAHDQSSPAYVIVARRDAIGPARATVIRGGGVRVAIFAVDGRLHAIDDTCLRCGASIGAGGRAGGLAICTGCGWIYDIVTGAVDGVPALRVERFQVVVDGADVRIAVPMRDRDTD